MTKALPPPDEYNTIVYDAGWPHYRLQPHTIWSTWTQMEPFARQGARMLEIGPGKWPHLPVDRAHFIDLSEAALSALRAAGGTCSSRQPPWPYEDASFDLVCFFETLEHVADDAGFLAEVARVIRPGGVIFLSCPMNPDYWTFYDGVVGHVRRYGAEELSRRLDAAGFTIEGVCARDDRMNRVYGWLFGLGAIYLTRLTIMLVQLALPFVAGKVCPWADGSFLGEAEKRGGVVLRARRRAAEPARSS